MDSEPLLQINLGARGAGAQEKGRTWGDHSPQALKIVETGCLWNR